MRRRYANPPVVEAVCEFRFGADTQWDLAVPGLVYEKVRELFPKREQRVVPRVEVKHSEEGFEQWVHADQRMFYLTDDGKTFLQIGARLLAVNRLKPYRGWNELRPAIASAFDALRATVAIQALERVGLRYINRVQLPGGDWELGDYFDIRPFLGPSLPQRFASFVVGCVLPFNEGRDSCRVQIANAPPDEPGTASFLLDLDYSLSDPGAITADQVLSWVEDAHTRIEDIFEGCLTDRLRVVFGEVQ